MKAGLLLMLLAAQAPVTELPNGWRISPVGKQIPTEDLILNLTVAPDERAVIALHGGFNPHGLVVVDTATEQARQRIPLKSAWLGMAWNGSTLYVSGGNANGREATVAPIYAFTYAQGQLTKLGEWRDGRPADKTYWSGLAYHAGTNRLYAANRGHDPRPGEVAMFDAATGKVTGHIPVEISPYDLVLSADGALLYVSNQGSDSISVIDTKTNKVVSRIAAGNNPNDLALTADGRLFAANGNENSVSVIDTARRVVIETINVGPTPQAPQGTTPNALAFDAKTGMLFVANADNNCIAVVNAAKPGQSEVLGFIPAGWYPSAVALTTKAKLYIGNSKGLAASANPEGPHSPLLRGKTSVNSIKHIQKGSIGIVSVAQLKQEIKGWTKRVYDNIPYKDDYLTRARPATAPSIVPREVGAGSPIKHVIYIIKENRTYDQVFGDIKKGKGDPRLTIFGENVTPNHHAIVNEWVLFDNLYCDGEVSVDGHSWSNSAIANDFNEKFWPPNYGGHSKALASLATVPQSGHMWDLARNKGLTYRSYGEYAARASDGTTMDASPGATGLYGHVAPKFKLPGMRDTDNVREFFREFDEYEKNFESRDPEKRLPNFIVMSLPEDHTRGTRPGEYTPRAMVANNDWAIGQLVERVSHSKYWPETAIFLIEDDAQDGPDHVDARRTVGAVISPYTKRGIVDSTLYTTSSMLRTMQLLLGLPPMTQYDAAAMPMYAAFGTQPDLRPFQALAPKIDVNEKNLATAWGAKASMEMDLDEIDRAPMYAFNEIIWKSVKGADSPMPAPVHRFWFQRK